MKSIGSILAALVLGVLLTASPYAGAFAAAPEETFLVPKDAEVQSFKLSPTADQTNYTVSLAYPERAVGEAQAQQLQAAGWHQCRAADSAQADWISTIDAATPDRTIHQHQTLWANGERLIIVKLRYFSAANAAVPDNNKQQVSLVFYNDRAQEMAKWLKADCSQ